MQAFSRPFLAAPPFSSPLLNSGCNHDTLLTPGGGGGLRPRAAETPTGSSQAAERGEAVYSSLGPPGPGTAGCAGSRGEDHTKKPKEGARSLQAFAVTSHTNAL